ncbi:hypothetical protein [Rhodococcoides kroppenstedtii]|uniref:hypothetical protein n=1 Tax=Rhodococcoides kroppenstedtii TaxID=293050 RepID=UPI003636D1E6
MTRPAAINSVEAENKADPENETTRKPARLTVNLTSKSNTALHRAAELSGHTKTEAINQALQLLEMTFAAQERGGGIWIQDSARSEPARLRIF